MDKQNSVVNDTEELFIEGKKITVKIADDNAEREQGLMNVQKLEGYDGMLFIFENAGLASFWNKNTLIDLDLVWINEGRVTGVDFLPNINKDGLKTVSSPGEVDMVLELPAGQAELRVIGNGALVSLPSRLK